MEYALAVVFALLLWWFSTGAVLYVVGLPKRTFGRSMAVVTILALLALVGMVVSSSDVTTLGAYCAFTCALLVWGLARDELPDRRRDRPAQHALPARQQRLGALRLCGADAALP